jgi:hypothetical protein
VLFVFFVLSVATEVVMFTNRSNIDQLPGKGNRRFSGANKNKEMLRSLILGTTGMHLA